MPQTKTVSSLGLRTGSKMTWNVGPFILRALLPWHNPRRDQDPRWMLDWIAGYAALPEGAPIPLVDTGHPDLPVPVFASQERPSDG